MMRLLCVCTSRNTILSLARTKMSLSTHMERTLGIAREEVKSDVVVRDIRELSPTVKGFTLQVSNSRLTFRPGQWVDLYIPDEDVVGGYSITSTPLCLRKSGTIDLAIKYSSHPPAHWMYTKCKVSDRLSVQIGGSFHYYPSSSDEEKDLLLIAGGMGINPLFSILQYQAYAHPARKVKLLFVAKMASELLFKKQLEELCVKSDVIEVQYFVTGEANHDMSMNSRRIGTEDLACAVSSMDPSRLACFICGPPPMADSTIQSLRDMGVPQNCIHCEKWW